MRPLCHAETTYVYWRVEHHVAKCRKYNRFVKRHMTRAKRRFLNKAEEFPRARRGSVKKEGGSE